MEEGKIIINSREYGVTVMDDKIIIKIEEQKDKISDIVTAARKGWNEIIISKYMYKNYYKVFLGNVIVYDDKITFSIIAKIYYPLVDEKNLPNIKSFYITAPVIDYFIDYKKELLDNSIRILKCFKDDNEENDSNKTEYTFMYNGKEYCMTISTMGVFDYDKRFPYDIKSYIKITSSDNLGENEIFDIAKLIKLFLQFISNKRIIDVDEINLLKENEDAVFTAQMHIIDCKNSFKISRWNILDYTIIKEHIGNLIQEISNNTICFRSLFNYEESVITNIDIMNICACFENQFNESYPKYKNQDFNQVKKEILKYINEYEDDKYNDEQKYQLEEIKKWIGYYRGTLKEKLEYSLNEFEKCMGKRYVKYRFGNNYIEMPKKFKDARNALDHGNMEYIFSSDEYKYVILVRAITYMMILKKIGMDQSKIKECIEQIFR